MTKQTGNTVIIILHVLTHVVGFDCADSLAGVVEYLSNGHVSMDHQDFKGRGYKNCIHKLAVTKNSAHSNPNPNKYTHGFNLTPSYVDEIMQYSNYTYDFKGIIDYIFHSKETIVTIAALGSIDLNWFKANKVVGCPHPNVPSGRCHILTYLQVGVTSLHPLRSVSHLNVRAGRSVSQPNVRSGPCHILASPQVGVTS